MPIGHSKAIWNQAMQVTSPDYQILNQFARNQKMHILQQIRKCIFTYLIIVTTATTGGGVPFSSRRTFFHREREMDCFYSENKNTENTKQNKKYANQNTKYAKQNTKYAISIKRVRQKKQICQKLI